MEYTHFAKYELHKVSSLTGRMYLDTCYRNKRCKKNTGAEETVQHTIAFHVFAYFEGISYLPPLPFHPTVGRGENNVLDLPTRAACQLDRFLRENGLIWPSKGQNIHEISLDKYVDPPAFLVCPKSVPKYFVCTSFACIFFYVLGICA